MPSKRSRHVSLVFFTLDELRDSLVARDTLRLLREFPEFEPQAFQVGERWFPIDGEAPDLAIEHWMRSSTATIRGGDPYKAEFVATTTFTAPGGYNNVIFWVEEAYFHVPENVERFLHLSAKMYSLLHSVYGNIHQTDDSIAMATITDSRYGETVVPTDLRKGLPNVYWANYLGPHYVSLIGKERLLATPCDRVQELPDGGVLVILGPSPLAAIGEQIRSTQRAIKSYWGDRFFYHWSGA